MVLRVLDRVSDFGASLVRTTTEVNTARQARPFTPATSWYDFLESYADNRPYDQFNRDYRARYGLTKGQRAIYNPAHRVANWYAGHVYPPGYGDIPFDPGTPPEIVDAITSAFTWGNMQQQTSLYVRMGARLGNVLLQAEIDIDSGRVYPMVTHPKYVKALEIDHRMNVTMYQTETPQWDPERKQSYRYGLRVTKDTFTTLYNDEPHAYGDNDAEIDNPFGFVPAVWVPHEVTDSTLGAPAIEAVIGKIDELNLITTSAHDFITKFTKQGVVFATDKGAKGLEAVNLGGSGGVNAEQQEIRYIVGPQDLKVMKMLENLGLDGAMTWAKELLGEIEADLPEIALDKDLRAMSNVTGPGAMRMTSDVVNKLADAQRNYDWGLIRIGQMCISMGAVLSKMRVGGWANQTDQQQAFNAFDEKSFDRGDLDFRFIDRPLLSETPMEKAQSAAAREALTTPQALLEAGYTPEEIWGTNEQGESLAPTTNDGILAQQEATAMRAQSRSVLNFNSGL
jgi:hypothetical protein